jgi:hypothetical protein
MEKPKEITVTDEEYNAVIGRMQLSDLSDADKLVLSHLLEPVANSHKTSLSRHSYAIKAQKL